MNRKFTVQYMSNTGTSWNMSHLGTSYKVKDGVLEIHGKDKKVVIIPLRSVLSVTIERA